MLLVKLFAIIFGYVALSCAAMIGPAYLLLRLGHARASLAVALGTMAALIVDHLYNWDGISYPHILLRGPNELFPLTILCAAGAVALGFMACLERV